VVVLCNVDRQVIGIITTAIGTLHKVPACPRDILKPVILSEANSFIIVHNHPAGNPRPSDEDREVFKTIRSAALAMLVRLEDSIILGTDGSYFSFHEEEARQFRKDMKAKRAKIVSKAVNRIERGVGSPRDVCLVAADRLNEVPVMVRTEGKTELEILIEKLKQVVKHPARIRRSVRLRAKDLLEVSTSMLDAISKGEHPDLELLAAVTPWSEPLPKTPELWTMFEFSEPGKHGKSKGKQNHQI
jgi:hypothetical protein